MTAQWASLSTPPRNSPLQFIFDSLQVWTEENSVSISHTKTVVMHFCTSSEAAFPPQISSGPHPLLVVQSTQLLGITVDNQLNLKHVTNIIREPSYIIYMLYILRLLRTPAAQLNGHMCASLHGPPLWTLHSNNSLRGFRKRQSRSFWTLFTLTATMV